MNCPVEQMSLAETERHGAPAFECPMCHGIWIEPSSLEDIEDRAFPDDAEKGTLKYGSHDSDLGCPHCGKQMVRFRYRANPLEIDHCPDDGGYWLDKDEDKHIMNLMRQRARDLRRSSSAQQSWQHMFKGHHSRGFIERIRDFFGRL